jgi:SAM-dependent methyltransferase
MNFTGERVIPGEVDADLFNEHWARYLFAQQFASGKKVLDAACGSGYGSALLSQTAARVVGTDIAHEAVDYARAHFGSPKTDYVRADCLALPFASGQFDLVVAYEIIEHLADAEGFLKELERVLTPPGLLLLSTPNRLYYTEDRGEVNPFHAQEYSYPEFSELLRRVFPHCAIYIENHVGGLLVSDPAQGGSSAGSPACQQSPESNDPTSPDKRKREAYYMVALASSRPLPNIQPLLYLPSSGNVLRERETHIQRLEEQLSEARGERDAVLSQVRTLESQLEERTQWAQGLAGQVEERTRWAQELDETLAEKNTCLINLQTDYDQKVKWAQGLQQEMETASVALGKLRQEFEERTGWALQLDADVKERTAWAQRLDAELKLRNEDLRLLYGSRWYRIGKNLRLSPIPASDQRKEKS